MNKNELVTSIADRLDLPKKQVEDVLDAFTDTVGDTLRRGERIALTGFGTFERRDRAARTAQNPQTGERMKVKAKKVPAFKPGQGLKDAVASSRGGGKKAAGKKSTSKKSAKKAAKETTGKKAAGKKAGAKKTAKASAKKGGAKKS